MHEPIVGFELSSGTFLLLLSMGYGLVRAPQLSWNERLLSNNVYYSYYQTAECSSKKSQILSKVEQKYEVALIDFQILNMLYSRYTRIEDRESVIEDIQKIRSLFNLELMIEIEGCTRMHGERAEKYQSKIHQLSNMTITHYWLVDFNTELKQEVYLFELAKTKTTQHILNAIYYIEIRRALKRGFKRLPTFCRAYYSENWMFKLFPRLGKIRSHQKSCGTNIVSGAGSISSFSSLQFLHYLSLSGNKVYSCLLLLKGQH